MRNLAGHVGATALFRAELAQCGIPAVPSIEPDGEVHAAVDGLVEVGGGFELRVVRRWLYASARLSQPLPADAAVEINAAPFAGAGTKYSGDPGTLGAVARAHGYSGGMDAVMLREWGPLDFWHVDSVEGLGALVTALRETIAARQLTAEAGRLAQVAWYTEGFLQEAATHIESDGVLGRIVREQLHDAALDGSDARIIALRAQYPAPVDPAAPSR